MNCLLILLETYILVGKKKKKKGTVHWPIEGKKNNILHHCVHSEENGRQIIRAE